MNFLRKRPSIITAEDALPGRPTPIRIASKHLVLSTPMEGPWPVGSQRATFAMGCFWGAEKFMWKVPGVYSTFVGYAGGFTPNPTYEEVCSGRTGHAEVAAVIYDGQPATYDALLKVFWENHDPTTLNRQGGDIGTQYRSAIHVHDDEQGRLSQESLDRYQLAIRAAGYGEIVTEISPAGDFYYAEDYHQQYLHRFPGGYCNHGFCQAVYPDAVGAGVISGEG